LDGLRAVSIGLVIFAHSMNGEFVGNLGVRIFFVISGYLITFLLLKEFNSTGSVNLKRFYFRRTMRIFAPFYFFLAMVGLASFLGFISLSSRALITPFTYTSNYLLADSWYTGHSWSLAVEEQFYLIFPPLLLALRKKKVIATLVFILLLAPVLRVIGYHLFPESVDVVVIYGFHANMDALASGCLLAFAAEYERSRRFLIKISKLPQTAVIVAAALIFVANLQGDHPHLFFGACVTFMNVGTALIIYWTIINSQNSFIGRVLNTKALSFIGVLSYSLYLWQQVFTGKEMHGYFPFNLLLVFACALISYYTVERYSLKLRTYLEQRSIRKQLSVVTS
jgi:peptidoglycan/LPS O-acetylase OafA/YrhL